MTDLFGFLILASLVALVVGLIKPTLFAKWIKNPTRKKVGLILGGLVFVFFIGFGMTTDTQTATTSNELSTQAQTSNNEPTSAPEAPALSEQDQIKKLVTDQLNGQNNNKKDNLKSVEVSEVDGGGWDVAVEFNASDNLSTNLRKKGIESDMSELYISLYKSGKDIKTVSVSAYFPLQDQYGNVNDRVVYASTLDNEEASKVNWNADQSSLKLSILPSVWTTTMLHPEFK